MNVIRTTTLAIGASLIGSSLPTVLTKLIEVLENEKRPTLIFSESAMMHLGILVIGIMFLLHGTGFLQEYIVRRISRWYGTKRPVIGIINDLPWSSEKGTFAWAWSKMEPREWHSKIEDATKKSKINAKPKLIKITRPWTRWFLDRYLVIINPYGSVYPEVDIKELTIWKSILHYVLHKGIFVNVADIPFYWAYDPKRKIRYELTRHHYVSMNKKLYHFAPYLEIPFLNELRINIINTETKKGEDINPMYSSLKLKSNLLKPNYLDQVAINRVVVVGKVEKGERKIEVNNVKSVVEELEWEGRLVTPLCSIHFGEGKFLVSLVFLEYDKQREDVKEKITNLQCDLVIKEVKDILRNQNNDDFT